MSGFTKGFPEPGIKAKLLDDRVRDNNDFLQPAINQDHDFTNAVSTEQTGKHKQVTYKEAVASPTLGTDASALFVKTGTDELYYLNSDGEKKLTEAGAINNEFTDMSQVSLDEDDMASDSDTHFATQQSIKAYVDTSSPAGMVSPYAGTLTPSGWLLCDGTTGLSTVANPEYLDLYAAIGTTYGGTSTTDFALPDMRGRVPVGLDSASVNLTSPTGSSLNESAAGEEEHAITTSELAEHSHLNSVGSSVAGSGFYHPELGNQFGTNNPGGVQMTRTSPTGGNEPHNNMQPYLTLNYIIKL